MKQDPSGYYQQHQQQLQHHIQTLAQQRNQYSVFRLSTLIAGVAAVYLLRSASPLLLWAIGISAAAAFLWLVKKHLRLGEELQFKKTLLKLVQEEQLIAQHQFTHRYSGAELAPPKHDYAGDLDIFGKASLFQYLHRTHSQQAHERLAQWLLQPAPTATVVERQQAAAELAQLPDWSLQFEAHNQEQPLTHRIQQQVLNWSSSPSRFYPKTVHNLLRFAWPAMTLSILFLHIIGVIAAPIFYALVLLWLMIAFLISRTITPIYHQLDKLVPTLKSVSGSLYSFENQSFNSTVLQRIQAPVKGIASSAIRKLSDILDRFDYRFNPLVYIPFNTFLLWDLQQVWLLEKWKQQYQLKIAQWIDHLIEMEALNSLGRFQFNHPAYAVPLISNAAAHFEAVELGHPLLPVNKCVTNSFSTTGQPAIALITGSNMAGKSTFLRSIGINQVLALAGAPVAAKQLTLANRRIMSSMRIADNLEENTSTFYAELTKLKNILEAVNAGEPVFLLLDEILRGTNSLDRQTGSRAFIQQLVRQNAVGLLATHDLVLTQLAQDHPNVITNYHFDVSVNGEELYFDYTLKPGVCQSMNASILMKKIGIEIT